MYNIGICDDGLNTCSFFEETVRKYAEKELLQVQVECWNSGESLKHALMNGCHIDVLFLDIEMYELSGIDIGKYIRNQMDDHCMQIIYISGKSFHAKDLFQVQPMDFLEKPVTDVQIEKALQLAIKLTDKWNKRFAYKIGKDLEWHLDQPGHSMEEGKIEFYGKMRDVLAKIPVGFQQIHHSYIINTMYVRRYQYDQVELVNGVILPISRSYRKEVRRRILQEG